jgi:hypothetical protein
MKVPNNSQKLPKFPKIPRIPKNSKKIPEFPRKKCPESQVSFPSNYTLKTTINEKMQAVLRYP